MGRKINPKVIRLGINRTWGSRWYADKKDFPQFLSQNLLIKNKVRESMKDAGVDSVEAVSYTHLDVYKRQIKSLPE